VNGSFPWFWTLSRGVRWRPGALPAAESLQAGLSIASNEVCAQSHDIPSISIVRSRLSLRSDTFSVKGRITNSRQVSEPEWPLGAGTALAFTVDGIQARRSCEEWTKVSHITSGALCPIRDKGKLQLLAPVPIQSMCELILQRP
jgi:hypothetical protein